MPVDTLRKPCLAYFVTPHGFGHAARAAAVMSSLSMQCPRSKLEIFTLAPEWFFLDSIPGPVGYHSLLTDIGLVQDSALEENVGQTCARLDRFLPYSEKVIRAAAASSSHLGCSLVVCDIAPMGISVARAAGVPSVLVENFTWDWIYDEYVADDRRMAGHASYLRKVFEAADYLVQTVPVCRPRPADLTAPPVARRPRMEPAETRRQLGLPDDAPVVLITMGGVPWQHTFLDHLSSLGDVSFLIPGAG